MGVTSTIAAVVAPVLIEMNQQKKAAEGAQNAANEQAKGIQQQIDAQKAKDKASLNQKGVEAGASQKAALAAIRAAMTTSGAAGGSILTGPQGAAPANTSSKTLLGV